DFRRQISQLSRMGTLREILAKLPGLRPLLGGLSDLDLDLVSEVKRIQGIIDSMTPAERVDPTLIDGPRRRRIAAGAGVHPAEVASLLRQFNAMAAMVRQMAATNSLESIRPWIRPSPQGDRFVT